MNQGADNHTAEITNKPPKKRLNGLVILGAIVLFIIYSTFQSQVTKIICTDEVLATKPKVIMLSAWWCPYCRKARSYLQNSNISYCEYDMEDNDQGKKLYEQSGAMSIPVLMIGKYILQGYDEDSINRALELSQDDNEKLN